MSRAIALLAAMNRGEVSRLALGRVDVEKMRLAAEEMVNWVPTTLGPMQFRPGTALVNGILGDQPSVTVPFVYSANDTALIELTPNQLRVIVDDAVLTRPAVASTFPAGAMTDDGLWTDTGTPGAVSNVAGGQMFIQNTAIGGSISSYAPMTVATAGVEHALRVAVQLGPVTLRVGTAAHGNDVMPDTVLTVGTHSLAFVPTAGTVYVEFEVGGLNRAVVVGAPLEAAGGVILPTPWAAAALPMLRWDQSADVVFVACAGQRPQRIERRRLRSWSLVEYRSDDGPFQVGTPDRVKLSVAGSVGVTTITASRRVFAAGDVGRLLRVFSPNYNYAYTLVATDAATPPVRVSGQGDERNFVFNVTGTFTGTWYLERSTTGPDTGFVLATGPGNTVDTVQGTTVVTNRTFNDQYPNLICWYRLRAAALGSGSMQAQIQHVGGGRTGTFRILDVLAQAQVRVQVITPASSDNPGDDWSFGEWSDSTVWPTAVALYDGRLAFAGGDRLWLSVSDNFASFAATLADGTTVGDSSAIARSVGYGPVAIMNWLLPLTRLLIGTLGSEVSVRSSALDAPLTPTGGFALRDCSTLGSAQVAAAKCDTKGVFVQRSGQRLIVLAYDVNSQDYGPLDLNRLHPDLNLGNPIRRIAVQRQPNTRIHCIRADGTAAVIIFEPNDEVQAWYRIAMPGAAIEDVTVLPDAIEDRVYYTVNRGGKRFRERFARLDEARGGTLSKVADCHVVYQGAPTATLGGLAHLAGQAVVVYADGRDRGVFTVSGGGTITLPVAVAQACIGLGYGARFKSAKLAYAAQGGTALNQVKRTIKLGLVLADTHAQGLRYGQDYDHLDDMPLIEDGAPIDATGGSGSYDEPMLVLDGTWNTDARLCLVAQAPRPATVMAASLMLETNG